METTIKDAWYRAGTLTADSRWLLLVVLALLAGHLQAADGDTPPGGVSLHDRKDGIELTNGVVALRLKKDSGTLVSLMYQGRELLAPGGGYVQIAYTSRKDKPGTRWEYRVVRQSTDLVEIAFVNVGPECTFEFASHFVLRAGESGFHHYLTWGHDVVRTPRLLKLAQYNLALRIDPRLFTTAAVDEQRIARFPAGELMVPERSVMDSTYALPEGGHYSKYFFAAERDERHPLHGAMGDGIGLWVIMPSHEHLNGGPEHQELTVHQGGASNVLLAHAQAAHYGAGILTSDPGKGSWRKVSAPWFIHVNSAATQRELWEEAKRVAAAAVAEWPYRWLDDADFQLERTTVRGVMTTQDGAPVARARVILAPHEAVLGPLLWQQQWRGYRFYGWTDEQGRFAIGQVRDGTYDVFTWQPGAFGFHVERGVTVSGGAVVDLGKVVWPRPLDRRTLWQIGTPDRTAQEFAFAEDFRQWGLWQKIADAFPAGAAYVAGESDEHDWPFQMAVTQEPDGSWRTPRWSVRFARPAQAAGRLALTLGIAAFEGRQRPQLEFHLNGELLGAIADLEISGAVHRSGIHAGYQERELVFPAERLRDGDNLLVISMPAPTRLAPRQLNALAAGLLWDCLRLEVLP